MSASKANLHERLRKATHEVHVELERVVGVSSRLTSLASYTDYLSDLLALYSAVEKAVGGFDFSPYGFQYRYPYRSRLLAADLDYLGIDSEVAGRSRTLAPPPRLRDVFAALGCIYVVEGSAKGARAILPDIEASLGLDSRGGASFFKGMGLEA